MGMIKIDPLREELSVVQVFLINRMEHLKKGTGLKHPKILRKQHSNPDPFTKSNWEFILPNS